MTTEHLILSKIDSWKMFDAIAGRYDVLNHLLSLGLDRSWRKSMARLLPTQSALQVLDVATGTADVLIAMLKANPRISLAYGIDMSEEMLKRGRAKIQKAGVEYRAVLSHGDAQAMAFPDQTFTAVTIAFGIRNMPDLRKALMEMYRVLRPSGRVIILEFSIPRNVVLRWGHLLYLRWVVPGVGFLVSGNFRAYKYLNHTVETFPYGNHFMKILKQMGFVQVAAHPLLGGVATIYVGEK